MVRHNGTITETYRPMPMTLAEITCQFGISHDLIADIAHHSLVEFIDLNVGNERGAGFLRESARIARADFALQWLRGRFADSSVTPSAPILDSPGLFDDVEAAALRAEADVRAAEHSVSQLLDALTAAFEQRAVLRALATLSGGVGGGSGGADRAGSLGTTEASAAAAAAGVACLACVADPVAVDGLMRAVSRLTRGNFLIRERRFSELPESGLQAEQLVAAGAEVGISVNVVKDDDETTKTTKTKAKAKANATPTGSDLAAIFIYYPAGIPTLALGVRRIAQSFGARVYNSQVTDLTNEIDHLTHRVLDLTGVLAAARAGHDDVMRGISRFFDAWAIVVQREAAVYATMNRCRIDPTGHVLVGQCWCPTEDMPAFRQAVAAADAAYGASVPTLIDEVARPADPATGVPISAPTYVPSNRWLKQFQNLAFTNGVPGPGEASPHVRMAATMPFLYGFMFADIGHGVLLALLALAMIVGEPKLKKSAPFVQDGLMGLIFSGRYVMLICGLCAAIMGVIFNDFFGLPTRLFPSAYDLTVPAAPTYRGSPYIFGIDPAWITAEDAMIFSNSFKMKLSVLVAVVHMHIGLAMNLSDIVHRRAWIEVVASFIPKIMFFSTFTIYMSFCIVYKWLKPWPDPSRAPSLISCLVNMFLAPGGAIEDPLYNGQATVQIVLLVIMVIGGLLLFTSAIAVEVNHVKHLRAAFGWKDLEAEAKKKAKKLAKAQKTTKDGYEALDHASAYSHSDADSIHSETALLGGHDHDHVDRSGPHADPSGPNPRQVVLPDGRISPLDIDEFCMAAGLPPTAEVFMLGMVESIEFALSAISHTASYLRLWAISLAHSQLAETIYDQILKYGVALANKSPWLGGPALAVLFIPWWAFTVGLLLVLEAISALLHSLRLEWIECSSKHAKNTGHKFKRLNLKRRWSFADDVAAIRSLN